MMMPYVSTSTALLLFSMVCSSTLLQFATAFVVVPSSFPTATHSSCTEALRPSSSSFRRTGLPSQSLSSASSSSSSSSRSYSSTPEVVQTDESGYLSPKSNKKESAVVPPLDSTTLGSLTVPSIGIGTISWSSERLLRLENNDLEELVDVAYNSNAAFFDTAERYGSNYKTALGMGWGETEKLTRLLLDRATNKSKQQQEQQSIHPIIKPVIATKFTPTPWRTTVQSVVNACEASRQRLGVDQIDLYQLHMPDIVQPLRFMGQDKAKDEIYWDGLAECYHRGLVKNVGVCNYGPTLLIKCQEALDRRGVPLASNQIAFSLLGRHNGAQATLDKCRERGIQVLAFFPFAMGLLTGKYYNNNTRSGPITTTQLPTNDKIEITEALSSLTKSKKTALEEQDLKRYAYGDGNSIPLGGVSPLLAVMETIARQRNKSIAQVALNYIICKGAIPIPGARTKAQVVDNIGAMGWRLTDDEIALLEEAADALGFDFEGAGFKRASEKFVGYGVERWNLD